MGDLAAMSLINEVLNELERRGANTPLSEAAIRPVPPRKPNLLVYGLPVLGVLLILLVAAKWYLGRAQGQVAPSAASAVAVVPSMSAVAVSSASMPEAASAVMADASMVAALPASP